MKNRSCKSVRPALAALLAVTFLGLAPMNATFAAATDSTFISEAWKTLAKTPSPSAKMMSDLAALIQKEPTNYQAHFLLATCYQRLGLPDQALTELKLAAKYGPNDPEPMIALIRDAVYTGQRDLATQVTQVASEKFPNNPEIAFWRGNFVLMHDKKYVEADKLFEKVFSSGVRVPNLKLSLANVRYHERKFNDAMILVKAQLRETPNSPGANLLASELYMHEKDYENAYIHLKRAYNHLVFSPNVARTYAQIAYWSGHFQDCLEPAIVQMALSSTKEDPSADDRDIQKIFTAACERVPKAKVREVVVTSGQILDSYKLYLQDPSFHRTLGKCLSAAGMHELAASEFEACLKRNPDDGAADFLLARELELYCGEYDNALAYYRRAKDHQVRVPNIDLYIEHLQSRMKSRDTDIAWRLKDWMRRQLSLEPGAPAGL